MFRKEGKTLFGNSGVVLWEYSEFLNQVFVARDRPLLNKHDVGFFHVLLLQLGLGQL